MPYRDDTEALEAKLRATIEARDALDVEIACTLERLRPHRDAARRRCVRTVARAAVYTVVLASIGALAASLVVCGPFCGHPLSRDVVLNHDAQVLRSASVMHIVETGECPELRELIHEGYLDPHLGNIRDPWERPYLIRCVGDDVDVGSAGPDGAWGTDDDRWASGATM